MEGQKDSFAPPRFFQEGRLPLLPPPPNPPPLGTVDVDGASPLPDLSAFRVICLPSFNESGTPTQTRMHRDETIMCPVTTAAQQNRSNSILDRKDVRQLY